MAELYSYQDYLESKVRIDYRSINRRVFSSFSQLLLKKRDPFILDVGTGTGLMIRKLITLPLRGNVRIFGIEKDEKNCSTAFRMIEKEMRNRFDHVSVDDGDLLSFSAGMALRVSVIHGDFFTNGRLEESAQEGFDCVTANAFLDIVPVQSTLHRIRGFLRDGGVFYSSINYDGVTCFLPCFENASFEKALIDEYNRSMDRRLVDGKPTGGSRTGSILFTEALKSGFCIENFGSSDWQIFPVRGKYKNYEKTFLSSILCTVFSESLKNPLLNSSELERWYKARSAQVEQNTLVFITHQTDILATRSNSCNDNINVVNT